MYRKTVSNIAEEIIKYYKIRMVLDIARRLYGDDIKIIVEDVLYSRILISEDGSRIKITTTVANDIGINLDNFRSMTISRLIENTDRYIDKLLEEVKDNVSKASIMCVMESIANRHHGVETKIIYPENKP